MNKTKIIATLGPSTDTEEKIVELIRAGMTVARINLSHGDRSSHQQCIHLVKKARQQTGTHTAILLDTRGPEIRVGDLEHPLDLRIGQTLTITSNPSTCSHERIDVNYPNLTKDVAIGNRILLDDGKLALRVEQIVAEDVVTKVLVSGKLSSRKRVSLPDSIVNLPSLTEQDISDIEFGVKQNIDFIAASFVRKAEDVLTIRRILEDKGSDQAIIAKIENRQGVENLDEILKTADGLMVARGDLGVEMPAEEVPVIQKKIIRAANRVGKPVITATQMLESMISSPTPTRAEASDVTNAIYDGTDAVMLSAETAVGLYPAEAIRFLSRCAEISEDSLDYEAILQSGLRDKRKTITNSISYACCATAADLEASAIVTCTTSGSTARMVARHRPSAPIIAVSPNRENLRKLQVVRGVTTVVGEHATTMDEQLDLSTHAVLRAGHVQNGDLVVITAGMPIGTTGTTNMLKVRTVADTCFTGQGEAGGIGEGRIHIVTKSRHWAELPGKAIIVVTDTNDTIRVYLPMIRGIITEGQGPDLHALEIGKEFGIPVVSSITDATKLFENNQTVTIDGTTGQISFGSRKVQ